MHRVSGYTSMWLATQHLLNNALCRGTSWFALMQPFSPQQMTLFASHGEKSIHRSELFSFYERTDFFSYQHANYLIGTNFRRQKLFVRLLLNFIGENGQNTLEIQKI